MKYLTKKINLLKAIVFALLVLTSFNLFAQLPGKVHFGLIYPISSNGTHAPLDTNNLSIHLLAGVSAAERGRTFAGFSNVILKDAVGSQFAGFSNHIKGTAVGTQFAGFANTYGGGSGAAFAGFTNIARGDIKGAQFAGFTNIAKNVKGAQFAGFLNYANSIKGAQFAGFMNVSNQNVSESQIAGFINKAGRRIREIRLQASSMWQKEFRGAQNRRFYQYCRAIRLPSRHHQHYKEW